jgi:NAD(P)-dependent dehydrogenase (short-subunit alcohol dehydrogenase family)
MHKMLNSNLVGAIAMNSIILPKFVDQRRGTIIHVGSTASTHAVGSVAYNTAKAGLAAYVRSAGNHFVKDEVLVCGINPGAFLAYDNSMSRLKKRSNDIYKKFIQERLPRRDMMPLNDIFKVLDFLSREPNLSLAGSMIAVDAGESLAYPS